MHLPANFDVVPGEEVCLNRCSVCLTSGEVAESLARLFYKIDTRKCLLQGGGPVEEAEFRTTWSALNTCKGRIFRSQVSVSMCKFDFGLGAISRMLISCWRGIVGDRHCLGVTVQFDILSICEAREIRSVAEKYTS